MLFSLNKQFAFTSMGQFVYALLSNCMRSRSQHFQFHPHFLSTYIYQLCGSHLTCLDRHSFYPVSRREMHIILSHKAFNHERRLVTFAWGDTLDFDSLSKMHSGDLMEAVFAVSWRIQKLDLGRTETVLLSCIALFFAGMY